MKKIIIFLFCIFSIQNAFAQRNYIIPEPTNISFLNSEDIGFRLSKKTSIEFRGVEKSKVYINDFLKFMENETGFILNEKTNKKSNIIFKTQDGINNLGNEGYKLSIIPKESILLEANTENGLFYGIETLKQIIH